MEESVLGTFHSTDPITFSGIRCTVVYEVKVSLDAMIKVSEEIEFAAVFNVKVTSQYCTFMGI